MNLRLCEIGTAPQMVRRLFGFSENVISAAAIVLMLGFSLATSGCDTASTVLENADTGVMLDSGSGSHTTDTGNNGDCPVDLVDCEGGCVDLQTDSHNCGQCGQACESGLSCVEGECTLVCPPGQDACEGRCYDLSNTDLHCGECDNACSPGEICSDGNCSVYCREGLVDCDGACVDVMSSPSHCGECGLQCEQGLLCNDGLCTLVCPEGFEECFGSCANLQNDITNCGQCGNVCQGSEICDGGNCTIICGTNMELCDGICASILSDRYNCGGCNVRCEPGEVCTDGLCEASCQVGQTDCGGNCVNLDRDVENCGQCGRSCDPGFVCLTGNCRLSCLTDQIECDGGCIDPSTDRNNCGECGNVCDQNRICEQGECIFTCPEGQDVCGDKCVNLQTDREHCSECDHACDVGDVCEDGVCMRPCGTGRMRCGEICVDLNSELQHCGVCNHACEGYEVCVDGQCQFGCPENYQVCGNACINPLTDSGNCGECGIVCQGTEVCTDGLCISRVTRVALDKGSITIAPGSNATLVASVVPSDATNPAVVWFSSNEAVATVDQAGLVQAVDFGVASITVTTDDGDHSAQCLVTVKTAVSGVSVDPEFLSLRPGETGTLVVTVAPEDATDKGVVWATDNQAVATVAQDGTVTAAGEVGAATITVTTNDGGLSAMAHVTVSAIPATGVSLPSETLTMLVGEELTMEASVEPANASNKGVIWLTSNSGIASVGRNSGVVTAISKGEVDITVVSVDGGFTDACRIRVLLPVSGVSLDQEDARLNRGDQITLVASVFPSNASNLAVVWDSSEPSVASVDQNGQVTALEQGQTVITVTTVDGAYSAACNVVVWVPVTNIAISPSALEMVPGGTRQLTLSITPPDASDLRYLKKSLNTSVATIDDNLVVTAHTPGRAVLTFTSLETLKTASCIVTVTIPVTGVSLNKTTLQLNPGTSETLVATVAPSNATYKEVYWSSSDPNKVSVDQSGRVSAVGSSGQAVVTVTTVDGGFTAQCTVMLALYDFSSHTFSTCGQSGRTGPSVSSCRSSYSSSSWTQDSANFNVSGGIQYWTVPQTGDYRIETWGAQGGTSNVAGGYGARVRGDFSLVVGQKLKILVGQAGSVQCCSRNGGGGGGSFVVTESNQPLVIAGGGGGSGCCYSTSRSQGTVSNSGNHGTCCSSSCICNAGSSGNGGGRGCCCCRGSGGGGLNGNGASDSGSSNGGYSFTNGGNGGARGSGYGGFGGGGSGGSNCSCSYYRSGGGGGGYSGGGGGRNRGQGGGGGSYNGGASQSQGSGENSGHGQVRITKL